MEAGFFGGKKVSESGIGAEVSGRIFPLLQ